MSRLPAFSFLRTVDLLTTPGPQLYASAPSRTESLPYLEYMAQNLARSLRSKASACASVNWMPRRYGSPG